MTSDNGFRALLEAMTAIVQQDGTRLAHVLQAAPHTDLYWTAFHHKCAGFLLSGIDTLHVRKSGMASLIKDLKTYCQSAMLQSVALTSQLKSIASILSGAGIPCVLLKGAAQLYANEPGAHWNHRYDLDLMIRQSDTDRALAALMERNYVNVYSPKEAAAWNGHHHLSPLALPGDSHTIELHIKLGSPEMISLPTDWESLSEHMEPFANDKMILRLDRYATALHLAIHGVGGVRLYDVVSLANIIRNDSSLVRRLMQLFEGEQIQRIPLLATLSLATSMLGSSLEVGSPVAAYTTWAIQRESLPRYLRTHSHFVEAWFANGGTLFGPATKIATYNFGGTVSPVHVVGRVATSLYVAAYSAVRRKR